MKKLNVIAGMLFLLIAVGANAQQIKMGYISVDNVVQLMPETAKIDSMLQRFQVDSLQPRYNYTLSEYLRKDSIVNGKDSLKTPASVRAKIKEDMLNDASELQNWQAYAQQATENKQNEFLAPIYQKVVEAIKAVAKEKGYTHVFNKEAFLVAPDGDDMLLMVADKLKIKLPNQTGATKPNISGKP